MNGETGLLGVLPAGTNYVARLRTVGLAEQAGRHETVLAIARAIRAAGGRSLLAGGCVRNMLLAHPPHDYDLEVYGLSPDALKRLARRFGRVSAVGDAFGILKLNTGTDIDLDLSLPREDSKIGAGHRGFAVRTDPFMRIEVACRRRDFTINSMLADPLTGELFDPFGGYHDLQARILRVTDAERFADDPLRVMRALQLAGRFGLTADAASMRIMRDVAPRLHELSKERFLYEWQKLMLKSPAPSAGLKLGMALGVFDALYPELARLTESPRQPDCRAADDTWTHTLETVDRAAALARRAGLVPEEALVLLLAALCHDLGRAAVPGDGHDAAGVAPAERFLVGIGVEHRTREKVVKLTGAHMWPHTAYADETERGQRVRDGAVRRLAARLVPATIAELALVAEADPAACGLGPERAPEDSPAAGWLRARAAALGVERGGPADALRGQDLIEHLGLPPGPGFREIIALANRLRDERDFTREGLIEHLHDVRDTGEAIARLEALLDGA